VCFFLGDTSSRKLLHMVRVINPFWFLLLSASGVVIGLSGVPEIVPLCAFLVSFANGSMYVPPPPRYGIIDGENSSGWLSCTQLRAIDHGHQVADYRSGTSATTRRTRSR